MDRNSERRTPPNLFRSPRRSEAGKRARTVESERAQSPEFPASEPRLWPLAAVAIAIFRKRERIMSARERVGRRRRRRRLDDATARGRSRVDWRTRRWPPAFRGATRRTKRRDTHSSLSG